MHYISEQTISKEELMGWKRLATIRHFFNGGVYILTILAVAASGASKPR
jgi:hypothetical protein